MYVTLNTSYNGFVMNILFLNSSMRSILKKLNFEPLRVHLIVLLHVANDEIVQFDKFIYIYMT